jgi:hypothetical protein
LPPRLIYLLEFDHRLLALVANGSPAIILGFAFSRSAFLGGHFFNTTVTFQCFPSRIFGPTLLPNGPTLVAKCCFFLA